jgi:hypothetical protein
MSTSRGLNKLTMIDLFPTQFIDEIINEVAGHECYSFTDNFSKYNQVPIANKDREKTTFVSKFGSFTYKFTSFGLNKCPNSLL